ncbi:MAG TPA: Ig-like domain repeat protein [Terriglobales bacterium]|nr:Ig-like domain repeat protein [Terriglobales bacterium]
MKRLLMPVAALTPVLVAVLLMVLFAPATAFSQNYPPPAGGSLTPPSVQILDLSGQPLPGGGNGETYVQYTADFTATQTSATITFAFRDDPADISFANVSVVDVTADSAVPLANNDFSQGTVGSTPTSWTWANVSGTGSEGVVQTGPSYCYTELYCWYDGSSQGYDTISQAITTVAGHNYQVSFFVAENSFCSTNGGGLTCNFSDTQLPGIAGTDVVVYVAGGTPVGTQTLTLALLDGGTGTVTDNVGTLTASNCYEAAGIVYQNGDVQTSGTCTASYPVGTALTLTAAPNVPTATNPLSTFGAPASGQVLAIPGWGGVCSPTKTNPLVCNLTMNSAESVTAAFVVQGQAAAETLTTGTPTTFPFDGGFQDTGGFDFVGQLTQGASTTGVVNALSTDPGTCNTIIGAAFPGAYCFVYQLGAAPGEPPDTAQMFELTCPTLPGGTCGSVQASNFFATLSSDFTFSTTENPGLTTPGGEGSQTLEYGGGNPYIGVVKFDGPDPYHPCFLSSGQAAPSPTNQVISFNFVDGNPKAKPATGGANGTGSCWLITYNMPNEAPTVSITDGPSNNQDIPLNTPTNAAFTCTAVNTNPQNLNPPPVPYGPFLTVSSCTLTDTYTGAQSPAVIPATAGSASANGSGAIDTSNPGPHTLVATVMDSAGNTISTSTITYNVQGSSSTVVSSSPNPSTYGQLVTFTATVTGVGTPTGQVTWTGIPDCVAATALNSSGVATCATSNLAASGTPYPVTTSYSGDNYNSIGPAGTLVGGQLVNPASQTISFTTAPPSSAAYNSSFPVAATASSSLAVAITGSGSCSGGGSGSATITMTSGTGPCTVTAIQAGNSNYLAAPTLTPTVNATQIAQTITFTTNAPSSAANGSSFTVAASASSGLTVAFTSSGSCSGSGSGSATYTMNSSSGTCSVIANQVGNGNYSAAPTITETVNATPPPAWSVTPANYAFPTSSIGQTPSYTFTVTNPVGGATTAISVNIPGSGNEGGSTPGEVDADDFVITSNGCRNVSLAGGQSCNVTVTWVPDSDNLGKGGHSLAYLQVANTSKKVLAYATMTGTAIDPTATVAVNGNNNPYSFTSTSKVTQTVATVSNSGPTMLILGSPSISSGNSNFALAAGSCTRGQMLAPNTNCIINVTFTPPSGSGTVNGKVTIPSNAANGTQTVLLSGQR